MTNGDVVVFSCSCGNNFGWKDQSEDGCFYCEVCGLTHTNMNGPGTIRWLPRGTLTVTPHDEQKLDTQQIIKDVCDEIKEMLLAKNKAYGDSATNPLRVFSKVDAIEQINVRIDDKLSRIAKGTEYQGDDTELDLIGYLILKRCVKRKQKDYDQTI